MVKLNSVVLAALFTIIVLTPMTAQSRIDGSDGIPVEYYDNQAYEDVVYNEPAVYGENGTSAILDEGLQAYNNKDYANAAILLREALSGGASNPDVKYMLIMSEMYSGDYASAIADGNEFSRAYPDSTLLPNVNYQKGKAFHYMGNNDQAVMTLSDFCHENPENPAYPSALYWLAECFYEDYNFDTAGGLYQRIIDIFPNDRKAVDARYKIDAIAQREREQKLLDLLKANNEEYLASKAEYERQLKDLESEDIATLKKKLADANARIAELESQLARQNTPTPAAVPVVTPVPTATPSAGTSSASPSPAPESTAAAQPASAKRRSGVTEQELLDLKIRASQLQRILDEKYSASRENKAD